MNELITEKKYPIQGKWILKSISGYLLSYLFVFLIYMGEAGRGIFYLIFITFSAICVIIYSTLQRKSFHFTVEDAYLTFQQGVLNKSQRHVPYGVIQNIIIKQDLIDRILNIASLVIENASQGGASKQDTQKKIFGITIDNRSNQQISTIGYDGSKTLIPGLTKQDAESLKTVILQKMKEHPLDDSQSGL